MIYIFCTSIFCIFITDKRQEWDKPSDEVDTLSLSTVELNQEDSLEKKKQNEKPEEPGQENSAEKIDEH